MFNLKQFFLSLLSLTSLKLVSGTLNNEHKFKYIKNGDSGFVFNNSPFDFRNNGHDRIAFGQFLVSVIIIHVIANPIEFFSRVPNTQNEGGDS